jgi:hypothetical protein
MLAHTTPSVCVDASLMTDAVLPNTVTLAMVVSPVASVVTARLATGVLDAPPVDTGDVIIVVADAVVVSALVDGASVLVGAFVAAAVVVVVVVVVVAAGAAFVVVDVALAVDRVPVHVHRRVPSTSLALDAPHDAAVKLLPTAAQLAALPANVHIVAPPPNDVLLIVAPVAAQLYKQRSHTQRPHPPHPTHT